MIDYSQYTKRTRIPQVKLEKSWLCHDCGRHWNYAMEIWGVPPRPCEWCGTVSRQIKAYTKPLSSMGRTLGFQSK